jgi:orotidine-5'-phosphate decarboxylase
MSSESDSKTTAEVRDRIIVALDVATADEARELVRELKDHVGMFKVGLELISSVGIGVVQQVVELGGSVFLDGKFHDIPNTVAGAARAATRLAVRMFNVHATGGLEMMRSAVVAARDEASALGRERPLVLAVTLLTSIDESAMNRELRIPGRLEAQVVHLAGLANQADLDGVIASPHEIEAVRANVSKDMLVVTPGVRPVWAAAQDQKRVMTPGEAISRGASYVVIGRPITRPPAEIGTPVAAVRHITDEIAGALVEKGVT